MASANDAVDMVDAVGAGGATDLLANQENDVENFDNTEESTDDSQPAEPVEMYSDLLPSMALIEGGDSRPRRNTKPPKRLEGFVTWEEPRSGPKQRVENTSVQTYTQRRTGHS